jgi:hypothetical protein
MELRRGILNVKKEWAIELKRKTFEAIVEQLRYRADRIDSLMKTGSDVSALDEIDDVLAMLKREVEEVKSCNHTIQRADAVEWVFNGNPE